MRPASLIATLAAGLAINVSAATAQALGTFRWQLEPYCNVVTLSVTQAGGLYHLDGTDDQCGAGRDQAAVRGLAFLNPDGTIGFGLSIVTAPGGAAVHVDAEVTLATLSGTWRDSAGGSGAFRPTPGAGTGGTARPLPAPTIPSAIRLLVDGGVLAGGQFGSGAIPTTGASTRMMWHPAKAAFRAGRVEGSEWDEANVGNYSTAVGLSTTARGVASTAMGHLTTASGDASVAMGQATLASGHFSTTAGVETVAEGIQSTAMGYRTRAAGHNSVSLGALTLAGGSTTLAAGYFTSATGDFSTALGSNVSTNAQRGSFIYGDFSSLSVIGNDAPNQFMVRAAGGYKLFTNAALTTGAVLAPNAGGWSNLSDAASKHRFEDLESEDVLSRLGTMPVRRWSYKAQDDAIRHIGPTAQDFHAAFGLGEDARYIGTVDAAGVALAAAQALETRTRDLPVRVAALETDNAALRAELDAATAHVADLRVRLAQLERLLSHRP